MPQSLECSCSFGGPPNIYEGPLTSGAYGQDLNFLSNDSTTRTRGRLRCIGQIGYDEGMLDAVFGRIWCAAFVFLEHEKVEIMYLAGLFNCSLVMLVSVLRGPEAQDQVEKQEFRSLHGDWNRASTEVDGKKITFGPDGNDNPGAKRANMSVIGSDFVFYGKYPHRVKLYPAAKPKRFNMTPEGEWAGPNKGIPYRGIYKIEGDRLFLCYIHGGQVWPQEFATKKYDGLVLDVFRRVKSADPPK
jgi:uncharacterized protein (TIGR03067 family)